MRWLWVGLFFFIGCAHVEPPESIPPPLPLLPPPMAEEPNAQPELPMEDRVRLMDSEPAWPKENALHVTTKANKRATVGPASQSFERAMLVYPYRPYGIYQLWVSFQGSLHIQLQTGEEIRLVAGLDPKEWLVQRDDATTVLEASHLAVTPQLADVHGKMTLLTAKAGESRVYYLDLKAHATSGIYGVSWRHPMKVQP